MSFALIAAIGKNRELGKKGGLVWELPGDLKFFKSVTMGYPIFMGLNTWRSLPGKLPGREHFVLAFDQKDVEGEVNVVTDLDKFVSEWKGRPEKMFVIGGGSLYAQMLPYVDEMYLTEIDATDIEADVFFPVFNAGEWTREVLSEGEGGGVNYSHALYRRKKPHWQSQNKRI